MRDVIALLFDGHARALDDQQQLRWRQAFCTPIIMYSGPVCWAWRRGDHDDLCPHDSCWDIMSDGASAYFRRVEALLAAR